MEIHIARDGQRMGPFPLEEVRQRLSAGTLLPTDLAWAEGKAGWAPLSSLPEVATGVPSALPPVLPFAAAPFQGPPQTSGAAITSLIFGILSITFLLPIIGPIVAVICGHTARGSIRNSAGRLGGEGMALAGLIMGYASLAFMVLLLPILAGIAIPVFAQVQLRGKETKSLSQGKQIVLACKLYALDHGGAYPKDLEELVPNYVTNRAVFVCPLSPTLPIGYDYYGGKDQDPPDTVVLMSKFADRHGKRILVFSDGSAALKAPPNALPAGQ